MVNFVPALAHFCLNLPAETLPAAFTQPGACLLVEPLYLNVAFINSPVSRTAMLHAEMGWVECFIAGSLAIMIKSDKYTSPFSPRLMDVINNSLNGSAGDDIRVMFYAALMEQMYPYFGKQKNDLHPLECYQRNYEF